MERLDGGNSFLLDRQGPAFPLRRGLHEIELEGLLPHFRDLDVFAHSPPKKTGG